MSQWGDVRVVNGQPVAICPHCQTRTPLPQIPYFVKCPECKQTYKVRHA